MPSTEDVRDLGKSIAQLHMKLGSVEKGLEARLEELAGATSTSRPAPARTSGGAELDTLLDLLDALDGALARRDRSPAPDPPRRGLFGRRPKPSAAPASEQTLWQGLDVASAAAHDRLGRVGIETVPVTGPLDARLHKVVETVEADLGGAAGGEPTIEKTLRRGWIRRGGTAPEVLRTAQVIARTRAKP